MCLYIKSLEWLIWNLFLNTLLNGRFGHSNVRLFFAYLTSAIPQKISEKNPSSTFNVSEKKLSKITGLAKGKDDKNGWLVKHKHDLWGHFQPAHHIYHLPLLKHLKSLLTKERSDNFESKFYSFHLNQKPNEIFFYFCPGDIIYFCGFEPHSRKYFLSSICPFKMPIALQKSYWIIENVLEYLKKPI